MKEKELKKNPHAASLARTRWKKTSKAERKAHGKMMVDKRIEKYGQKRRKRGVSNSLAQDNK